MDEICKGEVRTKNLKRRLQAYYSCYCPDKNKDESLDAVIQKYGDRPEALFRGLVDKYGPEPKQKHSIVLKRWINDKTETQQQMYYQAETEIEPIKAILNLGAERVDGSIILEEDKRRNNPGGLVLQLVYMSPAYTKIDHICGLHALLGEIIHNRFKLGRADLSSAARGLVRESHMAQNHGVDRRKKDYRKDAQKKKKQDQAGRLLYKR